MRREIENEDPGVLVEFVVFIWIGYRSLPSPVSKIIGGFDFGRMRCNMIGDI